MPRTIVRSYVTASKYRCTCDAERTGDTSGPCLWVGHAPSLCAITLDQPAPRPGCTDCNACRIRSNPPKES